MRDSTLVLSDLSRVNTGLAFHTQFLITHLYGTRPESVNINSYLYIVAIPIVTCIIGHSPSNLYFQLPNLRYNNLLDDLDNDHILVTPFSTRMSQFCVLCG